MVAERQVMWSLIISQLHHLQPASAAAGCRSTLEDRSPWTSRMITQSPQQHHHQPTRPSNNRISPPPSRPTSNCDWWPTRWRPASRDPISGQQGVARGVPTNLICADAATSVAAYVTSSYGGRARQWRRRRAGRHPVSEAMTSLVALAAPPSRSQTSVGISVGVATALLIANYYGAWSETLY